VKPLTAATVAVSVLAAAAIAFLMFHRPGASADPFAGAYPMVTPAPTPSAVPTWQPAGPPAGPLPTFHGQTSAVSGRTVDRASGVSYARFARPWKRPGVFSGFHRAGQELNSKRNDPKHFWYVAVYSGPLPADSDVPGPNRLRAGAELVGRQLVESLFPPNAVRKEVAGAPMTVDGRRAWVSAFRMFQPRGSNRVEKSRTVVFLAVDAGRPRPAIVQISVPDNQNRLLPDINLVIRSVRVLR
jgi:hypothetical protein